MAMQFYASPEQIMRDRSELARKGIARGRSAVVLSYAGGVLFVAENLSSTLHKVSEIYDRIGFAAVGKYNEFENLRRAGVRMADLNGLSYDRRDVTGLALANAYAQTLGAIFTEQSKPFEVEICVAEVGATPEEDSLYRLTYDGSVNDEPGRMAMGGQSEAIAGVLKSNHRPDMSLGDAVKVAVQALSSVGGEGGAARTIAANQLEVAVLDRSRVGRTFRRITGAALTALLDGSAAGEAADEDRAKTPTTPTEEAHKPTTSAGSADLEDKPGNPSEA
ncbi:proteasome subunit alpha [Micromonospora gifhornensis]|uniref:Proteasome subunit alpha n=1 Tax=Micromonospora gifhornensis TaxID=84594 RepID=A0ABQ4IAN9_9ACTN|nr:proteasome subunit alpha [Micromonospora gifhornensis]GIJ14981.1 proteasome subunit alpha [Micromonospora gifhornensis]